jgi:hypothetical protein
MRRQATKKPQPQVEQRPWSEAFQDSAIAFVNQLIDENRPRPESDVDLLVVMDTPLKETEQAVRICQAIEYHFGLDLIVRTPETMARRLALGDPFLHEVVSKGKVLSFIRAKLELSGTESEG